MGEEVVITEVSSGETIGRVKGVSYVLTGTGLWTDE